MFTSIGYLGTSITNTGACVPVQFRLLNEEDQSVVALEDTVGIANPLIVAVAPVKTFAEVIVTSVFSGPAVGQIILVKGILQSAVPCISNK